MFPLSKLLRHTAPALLALAAPAVARACGPDFPNAYLVMPGDRLAALPTLDFASEIARVFPPRTDAATLRGVSAEAAAAAECEEWRAALAAAGVPSERITALLEKPDRAAPPTELPREFQLYGAGAAAWRAKDFSAALTRWRELLALPAAERPRRSVWAAYMLGRALAADEASAAEARRHFQLARELAAQGFADSQGLALASLGEEARVLLQSRDHAGALRLYLQQQSLGEPSALASLQLTLQAVFALDDTSAATPPDSADFTPSPLRALGADRELRALVTAWFVARGGPNTPWTAHAAQRFRRWIGALPADASLTPTEADRWAWAAYQNGLWEQAGLFARFAAPDAAASEWVRAMLLLREGRIEDAAAHLANAAKAFPQDAALSTAAFAADGDRRFRATQQDLPAEQLNGVRATLALQRQQYVESLRLFLSAGHWPDAAYVAERVLTLDELAKFARAETHAAAAPRRAPDEYDWRGTTANRAPTAERDLRHLLARRLVRAGRFDEAREFFPVGFVATYDRYVVAVRRGYQRELPATTRADALWEAARLVREHGMELQGFELAPDFGIWDGNFRWPDTAATRPDSYRGNWDRDPVPGQLVASEDEFHRVARQQVPTRRFHYNHRAAELAWLASTLLPDDDARTAEILHTAGRWLAARYPEDAQLFYKTLVFRCPNTDLGKAAAARRWFVPPVEKEAEPTRSE